MMAITTAPQRTAALVCGLSHHKLVPEGVCKSVLYNQITRLSRWAILMSGQALQVAGPALANQHRTALEDQC